MSNLLLTIALFINVQNADDAKQIFEVVSKAQSAGVMKGDLKTYMSLWTFDARMIAGRSRRPGKQDVRLNRQQIENSRRIRFSQLKDWQVVLRYSQPKIVVNGTVAELRVISTVRIQGVALRVSETFKLRKTKRGWRAYENRWYQLDETINGKMTRFDDRHWQDRDRAVERQRGEKPFVRAFGLQQAMRIAEAHALIAGKTTKVDDWLLRGQLALQLGRTADAVWSFRQAARQGESKRVPAILRNEARSIPVAVAALKKRGAKIRRDKQGRIVEVNLQETQANDADLAHLEKLYFVEELSLHRTRVAGPGLRHLRRMEQLRILYLTDTRVSDETLKQLPFLSRLTILGLSGTKVGDDTLVRLAHLRTLRSLFLLDTKVSDAGVARLQKRLPKCEIVH